MADRWADEPTKEYRCDECGQIVPLSSSIVFGEAHRGCPKGGFFRLTNVAAPETPCRPEGSPQPHAEVAMPDQQASPTAGIQNNVPGHVQRRQALEAAAKDGNVGAQQRLDYLRTEPILQFFEHDHLPAVLQMISKPFSDLAHDLINTLPRNPERTVALRKLLEAKDAAVRAGIYL